MVGCSSTGFTKRRSRLPAPCLLAPWSAGRPRGSVDRVTKRSKKSKRSKRFNLLSWTSCPLNSARAEPRHFARPPSPPTPPRECVGGLGDRACDGLKNARDVFSRWVLSRSEFCRTSFVAECDFWRHNPCSWTLRRGSAFDRVAAIEFALTRVGARFCREASRQVTDRLESMAMTSVGVDAVRGRVCRNAA
jgi:hypothetical protein